MTESDAYIEPDMYTDLDDSSFDIKKYDSFTERVKKTDKVCTFQDFPGKVKKNS
tara:strand:+ start:76 stop:237 length:162 start_codon:yes stop_codon:yes gene_type:complete